MPFRRPSAKRRAPDRASPPANLPRRIVTAGDEVGAAALGRQVAGRLHQLRKERRLSLDQLALASGVSRAALSQIEGSRTNPTLSLLWKVAVGLGVPFHALLGGEQSGKAQVLRAGDAPPLRTTDGRMESRLLSPAGANQSLDVYELRFMPKGIHQSEPHGEGTTETLVVLTGALRVEVSEETHDLTAGDSMFFRADVRHSYENRSSHEARVIDIISYGRS